MLHPVAAAVVAGCRGGSGKGDAPRSKSAPFTAGMVSDKGGIGDLSFNWMAWEGLQRATGLDVAGTILDAFAGRAVPEEAQVSRA